MPQKRYKPALDKNATERAKTAEVWIVYDTKTKKPWPGMGGKRSTWSDVTLACGVLNSREN